jgi:hypothetical protein
MIRLARKTGIGGRKAGETQDGKGLLISAKRSHGRHGEHGRAAAPGPGERASFVAVMAGEKIALAAVVFDDAASVRLVEAVCMAAPGTSLVAFRVPANRFLEPLEWGTFTN